MFNEIYTSTKSRITSPLIKGEFPLFVQSKFSNASDFITAYIEWA